VEDPVHVDSNRVYGWPPLAALDHVYCVWGILPLRRGGQPLHLISLQRKCVATRGTLRSSMAVFDRDTFVQECMEARAETSDPQQTVRAVMEEAIAAPRKIEQAMGAPSGNPVFTTWHRSDALTILHVIWPPEVDLFAHDHNIWAVIGLYGGREDNRFFRRLPNGGIAPTGGKTLLKGDLVSLDADVVHAVANTSREWTGSIHVYGGDYFATPRNMWRGDPPHVEPFDAEELQQVLELAAHRAGRP
jgi:predicted metal-dependent enzyme (double-stranded beta helix superfamily)